MGDLLLGRPWDELEPVRKNRFCLTFRDELNIKSWLIKNVSFLDGEQIKIELYAYDNGEHIIELSTLQEEEVVLHLVNRTGVTILKGIIKGFTVENIYPRALDYSTDEKVEFICEAKYDTIVWKNK